MNIKWIFIFVISMLLFGCSDDKEIKAVDKEMREEEFFNALKKMERLRNPPVIAFQNAPELPVLSNEEKNYVSRHPFARWFVPGGEGALNYFTQFYGNGLCVEEDKLNFDQAECDLGVIEAIARAKHIGITITSEELLSRAYWKIVPHVYAMTRQEKIRLDKEIKALDKQQRRTATNTSKTIRLLKEKYRAEAIGK